MVNTLIAIAFLALAATLWRAAKILNACIIVSSYNDYKLRRHSGHLDRVIGAMEATSKAMQRLDNDRIAHAKAINAQATTQQQIEERLKRLEQRLNQ